MKTEEAEALSSWPEEVWNGIDEAVADESRRIKVAAKFLPGYGAMTEARTVPSERIRRGDEGFSIDEAPVTPLVEIWVEFELTRQQVAREAELATARTLARRAANKLAQAEDFLIFQGVRAFETAALLRQGRVLRRSGSTMAGLLNPIEPALSLTPPDPIEPALSLVVPPIEIPALGPEVFADLRTLDPTTPRFGEQTFEAVSKAYTRLQENEHHGPYALVLPPAPFADTQAALPETLLRPADRIYNLLKSEILATSHLPSREGVQPGERVQSGVLVSVGGSALELVVGREPEAAFMFEDAEGKYRFRVWERFALRIKDETAIVRLDFKSRAGKHCDQEQDRRSR